MDENEFNKSKELALKFLMEMKSIENKMLPKFESTLASLKASFNEENTPSKKEALQMEDMQQRITDEYSTIFLKYIDGADTSRGKKFVNFGTPSIYQKFDESQLIFSKVSSQCICILTPAAPLQKTKFIVKNTEHGYKIVAASYFNSQKDKWLKLTI